MHAQILCRAWIHYMCFRLSSNVSDKVHVDSGRFVARRVRSSSILVVPLIGRADYLSVVSECLEEYETSDEKLIVLISEESEVGKPDYLTRIESISERFPYIRTSTVSFGLLYGKGESALFECFRSSWLSDASAFARACGSLCNTSDSIHVADLGKYVAKLVGEVLAGSLSLSEVGNTHVSRSGTKVSAPKEVVTRRIWNTFNSSPLRIQTDDSDTSGEELVNMFEVDPLANVAAEDGLGIEWHCPDGLLAGSEISPMIVDEFRFWHKLRAIRFLFVKSGDRNIEGTLTQIASSLAEKHKLEQFRGLQGVMPPSRTARCRGFLAAAVDQTELASFLSTHHNATRLVIVTADALSELIPELPSSASALVLTPELLNSVPIADLLAAIEIHARARFDWLPRNFGYGLIESASETADAEIAVPSVARTAAEPLEPLKVEVSPKEERARSVHDQLMSMSAREYLDTINIAPVMAGLVEEVLRARPEDPVEYVAGKLEAHARSLVN